MAIKPENVETIKQWGIKAISARVSDEITEAAPKLGLTNGQLIEKMWEMWKHGGGLEQPVNPVDDLVKLVGAGGPWGEKNPLPSEVRKLMNAHARVARGLQPGITKGEAPKRIADQSTNVEGERLAFNGTGGL